MVDTMHCLYLGGFQDVCSCVVRLMIDSNAWGVRYGSAAEKMKRSVLAMLPDLHAYYARNGVDNSSRVNDFTKEMLGSQRKPALKLKGVETKTCLGFVAAMLQRFDLGDQGKALFIAGQAMQSIMHIFATHGRVIPDDQCVVLCDHAKRYVRRVTAGLVPDTPKRHQFLHLIGKVRVVGNPVYYATLLGERLNGVLSGIAAVAH